METIGIIAAMPQESKALLDCVREYERFTLGMFRGARFQLSDRHCLLLTSGMGLKRAMDATRALVAESDLHLLISFGIAGAINSDEHIGDVIVAGNTCMLQNGLPGQLHTLAALSLTAWDAADQVLQPFGAHLFAGTALTTRGSQIVLQRPELLTHPILEMETAGIAQIADGKGIPLLSIRSVSDGPQAPIPFNLKVMLDDQDNIRIGRMLMQILHRPQTILQALRMLRNSRVASSHAARALIAVLSLPTPVTCSV